MDLKQLFDNNSDCYADTWHDDHSTDPVTMVEGDVVPAMTRDKFIEVVSNLVNFGKEEETEDPNPVIPEKYRGMTQLEATIKSFEEDGRPFHKVVNPEGHEGTWTYLAFFKPGDEEGMIKFGLELYPLKSPSQLDHFIEFDPSGACGSISDTYAEWCEELGILDSDGNIVNWRL